MENLKKYTKPKFSVIKVYLSDSFLAGSDFDDETGEFSVKVQTFRIFDDSFDDFSSVEESDYATTTNTVEVW